MYRGGGGPRGSLEVVQARPGRDGRLQGSFWTILRKIGDQREVYILKVAQSWKDERMCVCEK